MNKKYLTVKEFADAAKISQQAVYKQISGRLKPFVKIEGKQKMIAAAALKEFYSIDSLIKVVQLEQPRSAPEYNDIQKKVEKVEQLENRTVEQLNSNQTKILEDQVKELQKQIQEIIKKDQEEKQFLRDQIKQKDKLIESLTDNLKIAQQLAAADKKKLLELEDKQDVVLEADDQKAAAVDNEVKEEQPIIRHSKKKTFFSKLFKR